MKFESFVLLLTFIYIPFEAPPAHAWGRKLDVKSLAGKYNYVPTPDTSIMCPETLTVVYDETTESLTSEIFQFQHIWGGSGHASDGIELDPNHAAYSTQWTDIKVNSNSIREEKVNQGTSTDTSRNPFPTGPFNSFGPGSLEASHLSNIVSVYTTKVTYTEKFGLLNKTVDVDGTDLGDNCEYKRVYTLR